MSDEMKERLSKVITESAEDIASLLTRAFMGGYDAAVADYNRKPVPQQSTSPDGSAELSSKAQKDGDVQGL